ncbi:MAG: hypothetical protein ACRCT1_22670 [Microcoleaceae cyanobacterium]
MSYTATTLSLKSLKELKEIADRLDAEPQGHTGHKASWIAGILDAQGKKPDAIGGFNCSALPHPFPETSIEENQNDENPISADQKGESVKGICEYCDTERTVLRLVHRPLADLLLCAKCASRFPDASMDGSFPDASMDGSKTPTFVDVQRVIGEMDEVFIDGVIEEITESNDLSFNPSDQDGIFTWAESLFCEPENKGIERIYQFWMTDQDWSELSVLMEEESEVAGDDQYDAGELQKRIKETLTNPSVIIALMIDWYLVGNQDLDRPVQLTDKDGLIYLSEASGEWAALGFPKQITLDYLSDSHWRYTIKSIPVTMEGSGGAIHSVDESLQSLRKLAESEEQQRKDKTLFLILKKEWFDAIRSGRKKEEYRAITPYWEKRLEGKSYDYITFQLGYESPESDERFTIPLSGISKGYPNPEWAPPEWHNKECYILKLNIESEVEFLERNLTEWLESHLRTTYFGTGDNEVTLFRKDFVFDCKDYFYRFGSRIPSDNTKIQEWIDSQDWKALFESSPTTGKSRFLEKLIQAWDDKQKVVGRGDIADFCSVIASPFIKSDQKIELWSENQAWRSIIEILDWYDCAVFDVNESTADADDDDEVLIEALEKATKITESLREQLFEIFDFDTDFNLIASKQEAYRQKMEEAYLKASATK